MPSIHLVEVALVDRIHVVVGDMGEDVVVAVVAVVALATGGWFLQRETEPEGSVYQQARLFDDVLAHVADYYVDSIDERRLYQMAIDGMLDQLHDPYSVYLKPDD